MTKKSNWMEDRFAGIEIDDSEDEIHTAEHIPTAEEIKNAEIEPDGSLPMVKPFKMNWDEYADATQDVDWHIVFGL